MAPVFEALRALGRCVAAGMSVSRVNSAAAPLTCSPTRNSFNASNVKRGNGACDGGKRRTFHEELVRTQMHLSGYGRSIGLSPQSSRAQIIFYDRLLSLPPPLAIAGDDLDEHFQFPVQTAVELVNSYFVAGLSALIEQEDWLLERRGRILSQVD